MRRTTLIAVGILALLGVLAGSSAASGGSVRSERAALVIVQRAPQVASLDFGAPGPSAGDVLVFRSDIYDRTNSTLLGDLNITCTQTIGPENLCRGIFRFTGQGALSVDALPVFPNATVGIVNGGSGQFARARGDADIQPQPDGTTIITFHLSPGGDED